MQKHTSAYLNRGLEGDLDDLELNQITKALEEGIDQEGYAKYYVADQRTLDMYFGFRGQQRRRRFGDDIK